MMSEQTPRQRRRLRSWFFASIDWVVAPERKPRDEAELRRLRILTGALLLVFSVTVLTLPHTVVTGQALQLGTSGSALFFIVVLLACLAAGMDDYVSKPVDRRDLVGMLRARGLWRAEPG